MNVLTKAEQNALRNRPRHTVHVSGRRGYTYRSAKERPGQVAKMKTVADFASKLTNQLERYGMTDRDERIIRRLTAYLGSLLEEQYAEPLRIKADEKAERRRKAG